MTTDRRSNPFLRTALLLIMASPMALLAEQPGSDRPWPKIAISKETTYVVGPLCADGRVNYVAAINRRFSEGVTPENNAAIPYWRAIGPRSIDKKRRKQYFEMLGIAELPENGEYFLSFSDFIDRYSGRKLSDGTEGLEQFEVVDRQYRQAQKRPWSKGEFPMVAEMLERNAKPLELFVEGTRRSRYYSPLVASDGVSLVSTLGQSGMIDSRDAVRCLAARAMLRLHEGKVADAWADALACHRWGRLTSHGPYLVDNLFASLWLQNACTATAAVAHYGGLSAEQANRFAADLRRLPPAGTIRDTLDFGERLFGLGCLAEIAVGGSRRLDAEIPPISGTNFLALLGLDESRQKAMKQLADDPRLDWEEAFRCLNSCYNQMVAAHDEASQAKRIKAVTQIDEQVAAHAAQATRPSSPGGSQDREEPKTLARNLVYLLSSGGMLTGQTTLNARNIQRAHESLAFLALALAAYRSDHGRYANTLGELSPAYIAELPKDPFTDGDLHYRLQGGGYLLYSVGPNGKDDGGRNFVRDDRGDRALDSATEKERSWDDIAIRTPGKNR